MLEKYVQRECIKWLRAAGAYVIRILHPTVCGQPDVIACLNGLFIGIEFKRSAGGILSPQQIKEHSCILAAGGRVYTVTSLEQLKEALCQMKS